MLLVASRFYGSSVWDEFVLEKLREWKSHVGVRLSHFRTITSVWRSLEVWLVLNNPRQQWRTLTNKPIVVASLRESLHCLLIKEQQKKLYYTFIKRPSTTMAWQNSMAFIVFHLNAMKMNILQAHCSVLTWHWRAALLAWRLHSCCSLARSGKLARLSICN